jgi:hypothetical protein
MLSERDYLCYAIGLLEYTVEQASKILDDIREKAGDAEADAVVAQISAAMREVAYERASGT